MWRRSFNSGATPALGDWKWDAIVIGGGHNGLTAAAYLARAGLSVAVLERRHIVGGAAVTEELIPGFKFSRCSYLQSLLRPAVIRELDLPRHGLKLLKRNPSSFTPCLDGRYLLLGPNKDQNYSEISKFSKRDADAYPRYEHQLENFCKFMDPLLDSPTPESLQGSSSFKQRLKNKLQNSAFWAGFLGRATSLGQKELVDFLDLLLSPASKVLNKWFETDVLKATLATDAVIGSMGNVSTPGSGYVLLHHVMGETDGDRGIWSYVEGGMGSVSAAICSAAREAGAHIVTSAEDQISGKKIGTAKERDGLYYLQEARVESPNTMHVKSDTFQSIKNKIWMYHFRLGHLAFSILKVMFPSLFKDFNDEVFHCDVCDVCELAKHKRAPHSKSDKICQNPFDLIH